MSADPFLSASSGKPFQRSGSSLLGPADADHFRIKVGRYGDRWYCDPLPADRRWAAWGGSVPSISTVKKASGSDWSFVALKRVNEALEQRPTRFNGMSGDERYEALKAINKLGLSAAARRGTNVHLYCEAKLYGSDWRIPAGAPGAEYMPAVDAWFDQHQPELIAAEYVVIKRTMFSPLSGEQIAGYGGTPDGLLRIGGEVYAIDWKSRGEDSDHGAYPEEAEQIAAGATADYMIVQGINGAERQEIPDVVGGLIVSIRPDGARSIPIDISDAASNWRARHAWWTARLNERKPVGKPWPITKGRETPTFAEPVPNVDPALVENLTGRLRAVASLSADVAQKVRANWPQGVPSLSAGGHTAEQFASLVALVEMAERATSAPFADPAVPAATRRKPAPSVPVVSHLSAEVDDGPEASDEQVIAVRAAYEALDEAGRSWIRALMLEASAAGRSFHLASNRSLRAVRIVDGLVSLSAAGADDSDAVRALVSLVMGSDDPLMPSIPAGDAVSALSLTEAAAFVAAVEMFVDGRFRASVDDDGLVRLAPVEKTTTTKGEQQ